MSRQFNAHGAVGDWERFANEDPYNYILTDLRGSNRLEFWQSGYQLVHEELLPIARAYGIRRGIALELGCGLGRLVFPLAAHFRQVVGGDIAPGMIQRARRFAEDNGIANTSFRQLQRAEDLSSDIELAENVDFLYSWLVFQHVPDLATIAAYLRAIGHLLARDGIAYLQFDTRPKSAAYHVRNKLPDFLLPRFWRTGIRRMRRSPEEIENCLRASDLQIVDQFGAASELHRYVLRKGAGRPRQT